MAAEKYPDMNIGAGTNAEQCIDALNAGAKFVVSPGILAAVEAGTRKMNIGKDVCCAFADGTKEILDNPTCSYVSLNNRNLMLIKGALQ